MHTGDAVLDDRNRHGGQFRVRSGHARRRRAVLAALGAVRHSVPLALRVVATHAYIRPRVRTAAAVHPTVYIRISRSDNHDGESVRGDDRLR